jgi:hypothetical protein
MQKPDDMRQDPPSFLKKSLLRSQFKSVSFVWFCGTIDTVEPGGGPFQRSTAWYVKESPYLWVCMTLDS